VETLKVQQDQSVAKKQALKEQRDILEKQVDKFRTLQEQSHTSSQAMKQQRDILEGQVESLKKALQMNQEEMKEQDKVLKEAAVQGVFPKKKDSDKEECIIS